MASTPVLKPHIDPDPDGTFNSHYYPHATVDAALAAKADTAYVDAQDATKADATALITTNATVAANTTAIDHVDPGSAGARGQMLWRGPAGPVWRDHLTLDIRDFGGVDDNTTDCTGAFTDAVAAATASGRRTILLPSVTTGVYRVNSTVQVNAGGITFASTGQWRFANAGGATIAYYGTGPLFQLGTNDGNAYDAGDYTGVASWFTLRNLYITHGAPDTLLGTDGVNQYKAGSYALRDWRCGEVFLDHVGIEHFEYGFWGISSDINEFSSIKLNYNHVGLYFGPRSDQLTISRVYSLLNDTALWLDRADTARIRDCQFVWDGTTTLPAIRIGSAWTTASLNTVFEDCWFERYGGAVDVNAIVEIGVGDSVTTSNVTFRNSTILSNVYGSGSAHAHSFLKVGNADKILIDRMGGNPENLEQLIEFVGSTSPMVSIYAGVFPTQKTNWKNSGTGSPGVYVETSSSGQRALVSPLLRLQQQTPGATEQLALGATGDAGRMTFRRGNDGVAAAIVGYPTSGEVNEYRTSVGGGSAYQTWYTGAAVTERMRLTTAGRFGVGHASPASLLHVNGSASFKGTFTTSSLTLDDTHHTVAFNGASLTATLPVASGCDGRRYTIKNVNSSSLSVSVTGGGTIDGSATALTLTQWQYVVLASIGNNWYVVGKG